jgi:NAD+ synthase
MSAVQEFSAELLRIDPAAACEKIQIAVRQQLFHELRRKGVVVGLSGGVDSSTAAALAVRAVGPGRVLGLLMPESESSGESLRLGKLVAGLLGIQTAIEEIGPILTAAGCYRRRDEAIRSLIPAYDDTYKCKLVLSDVVSESAYPIFSLIVRSPQGVTTKVRLPADVYLSIVAATNFKQRVRKMMEYYYADRLVYAVVGTPNRLEYDQGFFVKNGDGAADLKPIAHLYKTQVYTLARYLGLPEEICTRPPTTDTYPLEQSQQEFFFSLPYEKLDLCLYAKDHGWAPESVAGAVALTPEQVARAYSMIDAKRRAARYLHARPLLVETPATAQTAG